MRGCFLDKDERPEAGLGGSNRCGHAHGQFGDRVQNTPDRLCIRLAPAPYRSGRSQRRPNDRSPEVLFIKKAKIRKLYLFIKKAKITELLSR